MKNETDFVWDIRIDLARVEVLVEQLAEKAKGHAPIGDRETESLDAALKLMESLRNSLASRTQALHALSRGTV